MFHICNIGFDLLVPHKYPLVIILYSGVLVKANYNQKILDAKNRPLRLEDILNYNYDPVYPEALIHIKSALEYLSRC